MTLPERDNLLLIGAREPVAGETKTRLGATIGMERAAQLYRAFLIDLSHRFVPNGDFAPDYQFGWAFTPANGRFRSVINEMSPESNPENVLFVPQEGDDWGIRQSNLLRWGAEHHFARTVLTASDSPQMLRCAVELAFELLHDADVVIGRVHDGGYYLIGLRGFHDVLTGVPMSTQSAADKLVARAESMGLRVAEVPGTFDVDVEVDLELLIDLLDEDPEAAQATSQALRALNLIPDRQAARRPAETMLNDMQQANATDLYDSCYPPPNMKTPAKPKDRILDVADELFYGRGIHAVGVDEIVARSGAAKTTLYAHFSSKDQLVASYLQRRSEGWRVYLERELARFGGSPAVRIDRVFELLTEGCASPTFRGCPFINAAAEFPDPNHPARVVAATHRAWLRQLFTDLAIEANAADPGTLAVWLCMLYDATMITAHLNPGEDAASKSRDAVRILVESSRQPTATER